MNNIRLHTYKDYYEVLNRLLKPVETFYFTKYEINNINLINTNYSKEENILEIFSRILIAESIYNNYSQIPYIFQTIKKGVDPTSLNNWQITKDYSQSFVEMFPILLYLTRNKQAFNKNFSPTEKKKVQQWFLQINSYKICNNNWHFFPILTNLFLHKLDLDFNKQIIEESWTKIDQMYLGNGWYSDGNSRQKDYYNSFAFHFYSLLYAFYSNDKDRINTIKIRAELFAKTFIHFFANSGESIPFGRSLTYKFAHVAFWSIYSNFINDQQQLGVIKGIINRNLRWWLTKNIFNQNGLLINGYTYDNPYMLEQYNGTGSPYWAFKAFYCMLNPNSEYFNVKELPYPQIPNTKYIPEADICIQHSEGHSFAFINGQQNSFFCNKTAKYEKFVYSSLFGFNISRSFETLDMLAPDSTLAIKIGNNIIVRNNTTLIHNDENVQISDWSPIPRVTIRTHIFKGAPWHIRVHYVISTINFSLFDFGFSINSEDDNLQKEINKNEIYIIGCKSCSGVASLEGEINYIKCAPNTNILYPQSLLPYVHYSIHPGRHLYTTSVYGSLTIDKNNSKPSINSIKRIKNQLIAFGGVYKLPQTSMLQNLFIYIIRIYNKLSYISQHIKSKL